MTDKKAVKALIFDMDGVLVFTDTFHTKAWIEMGEHYGFSTPADIGNQVRGVGRMDALEIAISESNRSFTDEEKEEMAKYKNDVFLDYVSKMNEEDATEEVRDTLKELHNRGYRLAVGSSSKNTKMILDRVGLTDYFDAVADGTMIEHSKPAPDIFLKAAELLNQSPADCAVVEDANSGVDAAKKAGMFAVAIGDATGGDKWDLGINYFGGLLNIFDLALA